MDTKINKQQQKNPNGKNPNILRLKGYVINKIL